MPLRKWRASQRGDPWIGSAVRMGGICPGLAANGLARREVLPARSHLRRSNEMGETIVALQGKPKRRKAKTSSFGKAKREKFLDALALTCNIGKAADHAQVHRGTVCRARHRDPVFDAQFHAALAMGYDRIEALVLEYGGAGEEIEPDPERAEAEGLTPESFDFERAMKLLTYRRGERNGEPNRRTGRPRRAATRAETNAALMKALAAAKRRVEKRRDRDD